jgi:hypothetical protein
MENSRDQRTTPAPPDLAAFAPPSMVRPGHAFSLAPLSVGPPPPPKQPGMPARFLTQLSRYIPVDYSEDAAPLSTPGLDARARPAFTSPSTDASPAEPRTKRRRPAGTDAAPALPARATSHPLLATWHPLLAPSVAWPSAPMPPRALVLDMVSDAADAALAYIDKFAPPAAYEPSSRWVAPASPGDAEGAEAMLALLRGDGGGSGEEQSDGDADADSEEEEEEEEGPLQPRFAVDSASEHQCSACGTRNSPMWRKHPTWGTPLCNACGLRVMRGRPPLPPGSEAQPPPRRLFPQARTPRALPGKRSNGDLVNLGRAKDDSAGDGAGTVDGAATPGEATLRRPARGWKPNPKFYGVDSD